MRRKICALWLLFFVVLQPIYPAIAADDLTVEEAAYRLTFSPEVTFRVDGPVDHRDYVEAVSRAYSSLEGFKHNLKYFYYVEVPDSYYIQVLAEAGAGARQEETYQQVRRIAEQAAYYEEDRARIAYINNYLVDHVLYDYQSSTVTSLQNNLTNLSPWSAEGALLDGLAVCEGYAGAFMLICWELDIPCVKVTGELAGVPHAWNAVYLSDVGRWFHIDVTNNKRTSLLDGAFSILYQADLLHEKAYTWEEEILRASQDIKYPFLLDQQVTNLQSLGLVAGRTGGDLALTEGLTRNELAALLVRMTGLDVTQGDTENVFPDVAEWAQSAVAVCRSAGLLGGYPDGSFRGEAVVSKQEWAAVTLRLAQVPESRYSWMTVERQAVNEGLVSAGRTSNIHSRQARRGDVFDSMSRLLDQSALEGQPSEQIIA